MPKKEDVQIVRADDFQQVDEDLTEAMKQLDDANLRIEELLESPDTESPSLEGGTEEVEAAPDNDGEEQAQEPQDS